MDKALSIINQNNELDILRNRLAGNKSAIENLVHLYQTNPSKPLEIKLGKLLKESEKLHDKILDALKTNSLLNTGDTNKILTCFAHTLINSDDIEVKNYIKSVINSIDVDNDEITVEMK